MTEILELLKQFAPLVTSILVPLLGFVLKLIGDREDPGRIRSIKRHAAVLETLPDPAKPAMVDLITAQVKRHADIETRRSSRKLDKANLAALILVGVVMGTGLYWLLIWGGFWWPAYIAAALWGMSGLALIIAGLGQLFYYGDEPERKKTVAKTS